MASSAQDRLEYLREIWRKRRKKDQEAAAQKQPAKAEVASQPSSTVQQPARTQPTQTPVKTSTPSVQQTQQHVKQPSVADMLWYSGANILKTDDTNYIAGEPAKKAKSKKKTVQSDAPMVRVPNGDYIKDPVTGKMKSEQDITVPDIMLAFRQVPAEERQKVSDLFEQNYLKRRSSPYYDPYYSTKSNNKTAMKIWGTDDLLSVVTNPDNLKYLDYGVPNADGQSFKKPGKYASSNEWKAYSLSHLLQDYEDQEAALSELPGLNKQIGDLAQAYPDKSEEDILGMVDWNATDEDGNKAYKTINAYRDAAANFMEKYTVGGGLYVGDESLKAVVRAARRGEDVSQIKDYLQEDVDNRLWQDMTDENEGRRASTIPKDDPAKQNQPAAEKSIITQIGEKYQETQSNLSRIGSALGSLAGKAAQSTAGYLRDNFTAPSSMPDILGIDAQKKQQAAYDQSITTTGKIDLRDPNITQSQWPFLIQSGLASQDQADAILAQQNQQAQTKPLVSKWSGLDYTNVASSTDPSLQSLSRFVQQDQQGAVYVNPKMTNAWDRPVVRITKDNVEDARALGMDVQVGDYMSLASRSFSDDNGNEILITPIMQNGDLYSPDELEEYKKYLLEDGIEGVAKRDTDNLVIAIFNDGDPDKSAAHADRYATDLHKYQAKQNVLQEENPGQTNALKDNGMAHGSMQAQASTPKDRSTMTMRELLGHRDTLRRQLSELNRKDNAAQMQVPAIDQKIDKLQIQIQNGADPGPINEQLQQLYQQREELAGNGDQQAARAAAQLQLEQELANANEGLSTLRTNVLKRARAIQEKATVKPAETTEQRTARLATANIDALAADAANIEKTGTAAMERFNDLNLQIGAINEMLAGTTRDMIDQDPTLLGAYNELYKVTEERDALVSANPDIDLSKATDLNTWVMRKKQEVLDAAKYQYSVLDKTKADFTFYATSGEALKNPDPSFTGLGATLTPDNITNPATYAHDNQSAIAAAVVLGAGNKGDEQLNKLYNMGFMDDQEVGIYSYLLANKNNYGPEKAELYYQAILPELKQRQGASIAGSMKDRTVLQIAYGALAGAEGAMQGIAQAANPKEIRPYSAGEYAGMYTRENLKGTGPTLPNWLGGGSLGQSAYDVSYTMGNMVPTIAANAAVPGIGPVVIGVSAGGQAYKQSLEQGHTQEEAAKFAVLSGLSEAGMESVLGMSATGGGKLVSMVGKKTATAMTGAATDVLKGLAATMASNGTEEYLQDVIVPVFNTLAYNDEFKGVNWTDPQAIRDGLTGAIVAVVGDSPEIASKVMGTKAIGQNFNAQDQIALMLDAGQMAPPDSKARTDTEAAMARMEQGKPLDAYRTGKLVQSVGPELMNLAAQAPGYDAAHMPNDAQLDQPSMQPEPQPAPQPETAPNPADEIELTDKDIAAADIAAGQMAYQVSRDEKSFTPPMQRMKAQLDTLGQQLEKTLKTQLTASNKVSELRKSTGDVLISMSSGETSMESGLKQIERNAKESAAAKTEEQQAKAQYSATSDQYFRAHDEFSRAQGELYQSTYQIELNKQLAAARQKGLEAQAAAHAAALEEADRQASVARTTEIDTQVQELDTTDAKLATSEAYAKKTAQEALDAENAVLESIGTDGSKADQAEQASMKARTAYDRLQAVQKQRQQIQKQKDQLAKERADLTNKIGQASAPVKAEQLQSAEPAAQPVQAAQNVQPVQQAAQLSMQEPVPIAENPATPVNSAVQAQDINQPATAVQESKPVEPKQTRTAQKANPVVQEQSTPVLVESNPVQPEQPVQPNPAPKARSVPRKPKSAATPDSGKAKFLAGLSDGELFALAETNPDMVSEIEDEFERRDEARIALRTRGSTAVTEPELVVKPKTNSLRLATADGSAPLREGDPVGEFVPSKPSQVKIKRVSETAKELYTALGVKYTARNKPASLSKRDIAVYENHPGVVVTRTFQNVAAYAHEVGHAVFNRAKVFDGLGDPTDAYRADIERMVQALPDSFKRAYDESELPQEAAAEFVRNYLTDRNAALNFAGEDFVRRFETDILSRNEVKAMRKAREQFNAAQTAELVDNYRARIDYSGKQEVAKGAEGAWGRFVQGMADRYYSILLFDRAANKQGYDNRDTSKRAYIAFSNIPYAITQAANNVEQNLSTPDGTVIGASLKDVTRPITRTNMEDFNTFCIALHDIDRQAQGKPVMGDYTAETSAQVAKRLLQLHPEFRQVHQDLMRWWDAFIDEWVVKPNAIENAAEKVARFRELYPNYVPTFRSKNDQTDVMTEEFGDMGGMLGQASVHFQRAKGGDQAIKSPIASMVARIGEIVTATDKVLAMRRIHEAYQATPGLGDWLREVPADKLDGNGKDELLRIIDENGDVHHYQVLDKLLYDALLHGVSKGDGLILKAFGAITGVFKQLTTMSNPFFAISNAMRDYGEAYTKGSNANPVTFAGQWISAIAQLSASHVGKSSAMVDAYMAAGGGDSSISPRGMKGVQNIERVLYSKYFRSALQRMATGSSFKERARGGLDALHATGARLKETINTFNNVIEGSQRFAEFSRTLKRTGDAQAALYASTNVTTDFRRSGSSDALHKAGMVFAFMNAGIQGTYSWYRMAKEGRMDGKAFASKAARAVVMFAMVPIAQQLLAAALGDDDKEAYDAMAANIKSDNVLVPKSLIGGPAKEFIKIPKPKGPLSAVGDAMGRALMEAMQKDGSWDAFAAYGAQDYLQQTGGNLIDAVNPYGSPIFAPVLQIMMNRTWYGSPIESKWMVDENIAPANRIKDTTSSAAIWLSNLPGLRNKVSPIQVDYALNQTLGVVGDYVTGDAGNALIDKLAGKQNKSATTAALSSTGSFIRSRLNTDPTAANDITSSMYDSDTLLQGIASDAGQTGPNQDPYARLNPGLTASEQKAAVLEAKQMTKKGGVLYRAKQLTSKHYDEIDKVQADEKLTDEDKAMKVRDIKWQMILENTVAVKAAEDFIRKYIKGTPALYQRIYGKK